MVRRQGNHLEETSDEEEDSIEEEETQGEVNLVGLFKICQSSVF